MRGGFLRRLFLGDRPGSRSGVREPERTVLLITPFSSEQNTLRAISILERWRLLIAPSLEHALRISQQEPVNVVLYDRETPTVDWRESIRRLLRCNSAICVIVLTPVMVEQLRTSVLACGGYDAIRKPVERYALVRLVNSYWGLKLEIDALENSPVV